MAIHGTGRHSGRPSCTQSFVLSVVSAGLPTPTQRISLALADIAVPTPCQGRAAVALAYAERAAHYATHMMTTTTPESRAVIAYAAYCRAVNFTAYNGEPLPSFSEMPEDRQRAWIKAAGIVWDLATAGRAALD